MVVLPMDDGTRKYVYLGKYNSRESLEAYDRVVGEWLAKRTAPNRSAVLTVGDLAERYKSYHGEDRRFHLTSTVRILRELFGNRPAEEFKAMLFDRLKTQLIKQKYSRYFANQVIRHTKRIFCWAAQRELIPADNYTLIATVEPLSADEAPTKDVQPVDQATVDATLPLLSKDLQGMIKFIRASGCRPSEARLMRVADVDRQTWLVELKHHKTAHKGKARFLVIPPDVRAIILPRLLQPADRYVFGSDEDGHRPYERRALGRAIDRAVKRINAKRKAEGREDLLAHWHPYQLRHARAVEVREQYGAEVCQVLLGHAKIDMTQHYAGLTKAKAEEVAKMFG
jgi:integrase